MKNTKSVKGNFLVKFFSSIVFILSFSISVISFVCIIFLTIFGAFDSSKEAAINSMRDSIYYQVIQKYSDDALNLCVFGEKDVSIFDDTNFRFRVSDDYDNVILSNCQSGNEKYIFKYTQHFSYTLETHMYDEESEHFVASLMPLDYSIECFVDSSLKKSDQFSLINNVINIIYNMRFVSILLFILCIFATIVSFVFLMCAAGYHENSETPRLSWFDKIFFEFIIVMLIALVCGEILILEQINMFSTSLSISMAIWAFFMLLFDTAILLLICTSLTARLRCKSFWKTTLIYTILQGIWKILKKTFLFIAKAVSYIPSLWKLLTGIIVFCILEFILLLSFGIDDIICLFVLEKLIFIPLIIYAALMLLKLEQTSKKIASADMTATVDTKYFVGTFKKQGEHLNNIKLGIAQAVEDKMKSERFKTELITNVSHDIKTPLTSIINYVDLLEKEDLQNDNAKEYIQIIEKHSDRLKKLVIDLVDISKATSGVLQLNMQPLKIDVFLEQIAGEYSERLSQNNLELIMRKPEESIQIMADGQRIYRVFDNLMNNICKYALPNTRVYLLLEKKNNNAVISFKNISATELDMSADDLKERFVRGDRSRNTEGSGLGLSITESLTNLQNGDFNIELDGDLFKIIISFPIIENN